MSNISSKSEPSKAIKWQKKILRRFALSLIRYPELWTKKHEFVPESYWNFKHIVVAAKKLCQLLDLPFDMQVLRIQYYQFKCCYSDLIHLLVLDKIIACKPMLAQSFSHEVLKTAPPWFQYFESKYMLMHTVMQHIFDDMGANGNHSRLKCFLIQRMEACYGSASGLRELALDMIVPENALIDTWNDMCSLARHKLQLLMSAGDCPPPRPALGARLTLLDWRVADLLMLSGQCQLLDEASLVSLESQRPLIVLVHLMRRCKVEARPQPARAELRRRWARAHHIYNRHKLRASLVQLQRRWCELKAATRARLLPLCSGRAGAPQPLPIHVVVAKCFPHVVTQPMPSWQELVETGAIFKPFDHDAVKSDKGQEIKNNDENNDFYNESKLVHKDLETINLDRDDDILVIDDSSNDDVGFHCKQNSASSNKECTSLETSQDSQRQDVDIGQESDLLHILEKVDPKTVQPVIIFSSDSENDDDNDLELSDISDMNEISDDISELFSKACSENSEHDGRNSANSDLDMDMERGDADEEGHDIDPKLLMEAVVVLEKLPDNASTYSLHDLTSGVNCDRRKKTPSTSPFQMKQSKSIKLEHSYSFSVNRKRTYSPNLHLTHPDFNPKLLKLSPEFLSSDNTLRLLKLCKPVTVDLDRILFVMNAKLNEGAEVSGRVAKKVELPNIEEIRRINKNILTAQVAPIAISAKKSMIVLDASGSHSSTDATSASPDARTDAEPPPPTEQQLLDTIARLEAQKLTPVYCCSARRERARHDARLRLTTHGGRLYRYADAHSHGKKTCSCCCVHLLADDAGRLQTIKDVQRNLSNGFQVLLHELGCHAERILAKDDKEFTILKSYLTRKKKRLEAKSRKRKRQKCLSSNVKVKKTKKRHKEKSQNSSETKHADEYEEWMRQRHIGSILYGMKRLEIKTYEKKTSQKDCIDSTMDGQTTSIAAQQSLDAIKTSNASTVTSSRSVATSDKPQKPIVEYESHQNKDLTVEYFRKILEEMKNADLALTQSNTSVTQLGVSANQAGVSMNEDDVSLNQSVKRFVTPDTHQIHRETAAVIIEHSAANENSLSINQFVNQMDAKMNNHAAPVTPGTVQCAQTIHHLVAPCPTGTLPNQTMQDIPLSAQTIQHATASSPTGMLANQTMPENPITMNVSNAFQSQPLNNKLETSGQKRMFTDQLYTTLNDTSGQKRMPTDQLYTSLNDMLKQDQQIFDPVVKSGPIVKQPIVTLMPASSNEFCQPIQPEASDVNVHMLTNLMTDINKCISQSETYQKQPTSHVEKPVPNLFNPAVLTRIRDVIKHVTEQGPMPIITTVHSQYEPTATASSAQLPCTSKRPPWVSNSTSNPQLSQNTIDETLTESPIPVISEVKSLIASESGSLPVITNVSSLPSNEIIDVNDSDDEISEQLNFEQISKAPAIRAVDFIEGRDLNDTTLICLSAVEPPYILIGEFLVLTNSHINVTKPVYWSIGPRNQSHRIIFDQSESNESKQSSETNAYQSGNRLPEKVGYAFKSVDGLSQNINNMSKSGTNSSQSEINSCQSGSNTILNLNNRSELGNNTIQSENNTSESGNHTFQNGGDDSSQNFKPRLKVKSFAKMLEGNSVISTSKAISKNSDDVTLQHKIINAPDVILMLGIKYKKLVNAPVISYAKVLTAMNLKQCHDFIMSGRDVYFYSLETGVVSPLKRLPIASSNVDTPSSSSSCVLNKVPIGTPAGTPAGTSAGTPAGTSAGTSAGTPAGTSAGTPAGTSAGTPAGNSGNIPNQMSRVSLSTDMSAMRALHDLMSKLFAFQSRLQTMPISLHGVIDR